MDSALQALLAHEGRWAGTSILQDPHTGSPDPSPSNATVTPMLAGTFARVDYDWVYRGKPQEGSMTVGLDPASNEATLYWVDTWHMGRAGMVLRGPAEETELRATGSYAAGPGDPWGWRIELSMPDAASLRIAMVNIEPGGDESPAVDATYRRASR